MSALSTLQLTLRGVQLEEAQAYAYTEMQKYSTCCLQAHKTS